jgi:TRAP-type C4-dicarboxylate transport system permease large subunit
LIVLSVFVVSWASCVFTSGVISGLLNECFLLLLVVFWGELLNDRPRRRRLFWVVFLGELLNDRPRLLFLVIGVGELFNVVLSESSLSVSMLSLFI